MKGFSKSRSLILAVACGLLLAACDDQQQSYDDMSYDDQYVLNDMEDNMDEMTSSFEYNLGFEAAEYQDIMMSGKNEVLFGFDKDSLTDTDRMHLDEVATFMMQQSDRRFIAEGHTDDRGTDAYNLALGERRARAVKTYLVSKGIASDRIEIISYGSMRPAVSGTGASVWAANRRVNIVYSNN